MVRATKITKPTTESANQAAEPSVTEAQVVLKNARALRVDLTNALEDNRMKAGQLREELHELAAKRDELDSKVALMESKLADLDVDLSRAKRTAALTVGSEIEHSSRRRVEDLMKRRNQLVMDIDATRTDIDVQKIRLDDQVQRVQADLVKLVDEDETLTAAIADIQREEIEAREQRGREVLARLEADIEAAERDYQRAKSEAADHFQRVMELRMSAKTTLREFDLAEDAERLSPHVDAPISPAERVFHAQHEYLTAMMHANGVLWVDALRLGGTPRQVQQTLIDIFSLSPGAIADWLRGRPIEVSAKARDTENYVAIVRERMSKPRVNGGR